MINLISKTGILDTRTGHLIEKVNALQEKHYKEAKTRAGQNKNKTEKRARKETGREQDCYLGLEDTDNTQQVIPKVDSIDCTAKVRQTTNGRGVYELFMKQSNCSQ